MNVRHLIVGFSLCVFGFSNAAIIAFNFTGIDNANALSASDLAGLVGDETNNPLGSTLTGHWNNLNGNTGSNVGSLTASTGAIAEGVTVSWSADNVWSLPNTPTGTNTSANTTMMRGYLDSANENTATVTVSGLTPLSGTYSVVVYTDGSNSNSWTRGTYIIGSTSVVNEDSEGVNFNSGSGNNANGLFQIPVAGGTGNQNWPFSPNNSEGNVIIFTGLSGSSFTLTATPGDTSDLNTQRAVINGIQIVGVIPEPANVSLLIGLVSAIGFFIRRCRPFSQFRNASRPISAG